MAKWLGKKRDDYVGKKKLSIGLDIAIVLSAALFLTSGYLLLRDLFAYKEGSDDYSGVYDNTVTQPDETDPWQYLHIDVGELAQINSDFVCWLDIPDTDISYPVVQGSDNSYYLQVTFTDSWNDAGTLFIDYRQSADIAAPGHNIIYGHKMLNGSMFGTLNKYKDSEYWQAHKYIYLYNADGVYIFEIFSTHTVSVDDVTYTLDLSTPQQILAFGDSMRAAADYSTDYIFNGSESIITLSTCVANNDNLRYVVQAALTEFVPWLESE